MDLVLRSEYWDDGPARRAFQDFIREIHGLDFSEWEKAGYWDPAYTPFSLFERGKVVASVCLYLLDVVLDGRPTRLAQISGVGTRPGWRRRGLNRRLTEAALAWARDRHEGVFLFANTGAIPFYERCGFRRIEEFVETVEAPPASLRDGAVKLDPGVGRDRETIHGRAIRRAPVSGRLGVLNDRLVMFHALHGLRDHAYEIPEIDCVVFFERKGGLLKIYDIVGETIPPLAELYPFIGRASDRTVELHFHSDRLGISGAETRALEGNNPFVLGPFPIERPVFPYTSRA